MEKQQQDPFLKFANAVFNVPAHGPIKKPQPKSTERFADDLMEAYVKFGSYIGLSLSFGVFAGICSLSYWAFYMQNPARIIHDFTDVIIIGSTLAVAAVSATVTFFYASILWMPILIGGIAIVVLANHAILTFHNLLH